MDINATLIGQMITFAIFVWFSMKYVWPVLEKNLKDRQDKIAQGLMAADRGHQTLETAQRTAIQHIHEAREQALQLIAQANKQATCIIEQAKQAAHQEREQLIASGQLEIDQQRALAREQLQQEVVNLVIHTTEKLLGRTMNNADHQALLHLHREEANG